MSERKRVVYVAERTAKWVTVVSSTGVTASIEEMHGGQPTASFGAYQLLDFLRHHFVILTDGLGFVIPVGIAFEPELMVNRFIAWRGDNLEALPWSKA